MQVSSDLKNVRNVSLEIIDYIKSNKKNITEDTLFDIRLCVEEAVRNAIIHGNKQQKDLSVQVSYVFSGNKIRITIEDKGEGFDFKKLPDPRKSENLYKESGRGVYLIHSLMDKVTYNKKGNAITMEKELTCE